MRDEQSDVDQRLQKVVDQLCDLAAGNTQKEYSSSSRGDIIDAIVEGINMIGEVFRANHEEVEYYRKNAELLQLSLGARNMGLWHFSDQKIKIDNNLQKILALPESLSKDIFLQHFEETDRNKLLEELRFDSENHNSRSLEVNFTKDDGRNLWLFFIFENYSLDNEVGIRGSILDVTKHKEIEKEKQKLQQKLFESQKLEALGKLAGGVAHDFNNILGTIQSIIDNLKHGKDLTNDQVVAYISKSVKNGKELISQIFSYTQADHRVVTEPVSFTQAVHDALTYIVDNLPANISIETKISSQDLIVAGSRMHFDRIIQNLFNNAIAALEDSGGRLKVSLQTEKELAAENEAMVSFIVEDDGPGIPAVIISKVFEPFFTTKSRQRGTGLGLAVVQAIVNQLGGEIIVESEINCYTRIKVLLPICQEVPVSNGEESINIATGNESVLLVDDEVMQLTMNQLNLSHFGYQVEIATSGHQALSLLHSTQKKFDLIVTDEAMPEMSGIELCDEIRKNGIFLPIVIATGDTTALANQNIERFKISAILEKPFDINELANLIAKLLNQTK